MAGPDFSVEAARRAAREGRLDDWVIEFLSSPGSDNEPLAADLAFDGRTYFGPIQLEIDRLRPLAGPEDDEVLVPVDEAEWEADVAAMKEELRDGWEPPPLVATYRDGTYWLEDGNHRHETLRRCGETEAWVIVSFVDRAERDAFATAWSARQELERLPRESDATRP